MKKRLRKKKHVGEFQQLGFELEGDLRAGMGRAADEAFTDRFLAHIEARQLMFGGGIGGGEVGGFVSRFDRGSATEDDRASVSAFLASDPDVVRHVVGELRDAWY
jgi:uncharacterized protein YggL (DUF469 family)